MESEVLGPPEGVESECTYDSCVMDLCMLEAVLTLQGRWSRRWGCWRR